MKYLDMSAYIEHPEDMEEGSATHIGVFMCEKGGRMISFHKIDKDFVKDDLYSLILKYEFSDSVSTKFIESVAERFMSEDHYISFHSEYPGAEGAYELSVQRMLISKDNWNMDMRSSMGQI